MSGRRAKAIRKVIPEIAKAIDQQARTAKWHAEVHGQRLDRKVWTLPALVDDAVLWSPPSIRRHVGRCLRAALKTLAVQR